MLSPSVYQGDLDFIKTIKASPWNSAERLFFAVLAAADFAVFVAPVAVADIVYQLSYFGT